MKLLADRSMKMLDHAISVSRKLSPFDCALYLTLIILIVERPDVQSVGLLSSIGVIVRPLLYSWVYWLILTLLFVTVSWQPWYAVANHIYLQAYWLLAIAICLKSDRREELLAKSARWIVGFVFFYAVIWKIRTPEFVDGRFMEFSILTDLRLAPLAGVLGIDFETVLQNREWLNHYTRAGDLSGEAQLVTVDGIRTVSLWLSWWTILIEFAIALVFLLPNKRVSQTWRHSCLIVFIYSTYLLAPVVGFGWAITAMGMSLVDRSSKSFWTAIYVLAFVLIFLSRNPGLDAIFIRLGLM